MSIFKTGQTIKENCKCHKEVIGVINAKGYAVFNCSCGNGWQYAMRGKGKGSGFSSADLNRILKTRPVSIGR